jgi:hypothetical protein
VIGETWQEYRRHAPRLLPLAAAGTVVAIGASELVRFAVLGGLLLFVIPGICLAVMWSVCVPVIVIERAGPLAALGRSRELIRGYGLSVFGRLVGLALIQSVVSMVVRAAVAWLPAAWQLVVEQGVTYALFIPAGAVLATLMYCRLTAAEAAEQAAAAAAGIY